jgi:hypothetical protein
LRSQIVAGTSGFADSKGDLVFTGRIDPIAQSGRGVYSGNWVRPGQPASASKLPKKKKRRCHGKPRGHCRASCRRR